MSYRIRSFFYCQILAVLGSVLSISLPIEASSRKDIIVMANGSRFTGEVKSLRNGVLYVRTDYVAENISMDWAQVQRVESSAVYQITLVNGDE